MKKKFNLNFILILIGVVFLYIFPVFKDYYLLNVFSIAVIYAVYAASWDFLSGFTGKENFGHAAFIAIGGYMIGFISSVYPIKPFLSIPLAAVVSAIFGILIGLPTLKLKGPYFALATLAVATIFEKLSISLSDLTGGEEGIYGIEFLTQGQISSFYFVLTFAVLAILIMYILGKSN
ncbi:MAG TPA: branched-chain amino acid ABC transporter permease, partial [Tepiditoga sp.]|nr:branched-chain amino acid ABC transporter permease [Tepiditoga sp.]